MRATTTLLLIAAIACRAIGCTPPAEPRPEPANQPARPPANQPAETPVLNQRIAQTAARTDTANVEAQYGKMIKACIACHETYVPDEREPKNPLPWKQRRR